MPPGDNCSMSPTPATRPNSVATGPGESVVTDTPVPASSACSDSLKVCTNDFVAAYVAKPGKGWKAATLATFRIAPAPRSTIGHRKAPVSSWRASTLRRTICCSRSSGRPSNRPKEPKPALLTTPLTCVSASLSRPMSDQRARSSDRSHGSTTTVTPVARRSSVASSCKRSSRRATSVTP
ncbi:MAG: hypothetical protein JWP18_1243 [Solirubrobacterales bacterium]|nr:hypothetical protein [Solirubrobacterales bacterium]